jgi:hypothetical protein
MFEKRACGTRRARRLALEGTGLKTLRYELQLDHYTTCYFPVVLRMG